MNAQQATDFPQDHSPTSQDEPEDPEDRDTTAEETLAEESGEATGHTRNQNQQRRDDQENSQAPPPGQEDIKIVIFRTANRSTIGVHRTGTDPHLEVYHHGDLDLLLETAPTTVQSALRKWESQPRNPKHSPPAKTKQRKNQKKATKGAAPPAETDQNETNQGITPKETPVKGQPDQTEATDRITQPETSSNNQPETPAVNQPAQAAFSLF